MNILKKECVTVKDRLTKNTIIDKLLTDFIADIQAQELSLKNLPSKPYPNIYTNIKYNPYTYNTNKQVKKSVIPIGIDTESDTQGKCFMIAFSDNTVVKNTEIPYIFFTRKYRDKTFIAFNLKYDMGAILQHLTKENLIELQTNDKCIQGKYKYKVIANKLLVINLKKHSVHIYDAYNFFNMSLQKAAKLFLNNSKLDIETKEFTTKYIKDNYDKIAKYCIQDAKLVQDLMIKMIKSFEEFDIYPRKFYSVAYMSALHFKNKCKYIHVKRFYKNHKELLQYAINSYAGGKFEVTEKGTGYFYEYDLVSAYPATISKLIDISQAYVIESKTYIEYCTYAFIKCKIYIPISVYSPVAVKYKSLNKYPSGTFIKTITNLEYIYLLKKGCDIKIINGFFLINDKITFPYKDEIIKLVKQKAIYKTENNIIQYHNVKILLNSFYGKFVQLIWDKNIYKAGNLWNVIYGSIITADTRIKITEMQNKYPDVIAVHTDSIISKSKLDIQCGKNLGDMDFEIEGSGLILGSGIYQIGNKSKLRGFHTKIPLLELIPKTGTKLSLNYTNVVSWREVANRKMDIEYINRFIAAYKDLDLNFDTKRIWLNDYKDFSEVLHRNIESLPTMI